MKQALRGNFRLPAAHPGLYLPNSTSKMPWSNGTRLSSQCVKVQGFAWMQGEADALEASRASMWATRFQILVQRLRLIVGNPKMPVVVGRIRAPLQNTQKGAIVREQQVHLASSSPFMDCDRGGRLEPTLQTTTGLSKFEALPLRPIARQGSTPTTCGSTAGKRQTPASCIST